MNEFYHISNEKDFFIVITFFCTNVREKVDLNSGFCLLYSFGSGSMTRSGVGSISDEDESLSACLA